MTADAAWKRLSVLLVRRRVDLDRRYRNRRLFAEERGIEYHKISDIERSRRMNFEPATIAEIEAAYGLDAGAIERFLAGGELVPTEGGEPPSQQQPPAEPDPIAQIDAWVTWIRSLPDDEQDREIGAILRRVQAPRPPQRRREAS